MPFIHSDEVGPSSGSFIYLGGLRIERYGLQLVWGDGDSPEVGLMDRPARVFREERHPALFAFLLTRVGVAHDLVEGVLVFLTEVQGGGTT